MVLPTFSAALANTRPPVHLIGNKTKNITFRIILDAICFILKRLFAITYYVRFWGRLRYQFCLFHGCDAEALHQIRTMDRRQWHESTQNAAQACYGEEVINTVLSHPVKSKCTPKHFNIIFRKVVLTGTLYAKYHFVLNRAKKLEVSNHFKFRSDHYLWPACYNF